MPLATLLSNSRVQARLASSLFLLPLVSACDSGDEVPVDRAQWRGEGEGVSFRSSKIGSGSGSTRLNTAKVFGSLDIGSFDRRGVGGADDGGATKYVFVGVSFGAGKLYKAHDQSVDIQVIDGIAQINGDPQRLEDMVGSEWFFAVHGCEHWYSVAITGAAMVGTPDGSGMPLYNFKWAEKVHPSTDMSAVQGVCGFPAPEELCGAECNGFTPEVCDELDPITLNNLDPDGEIGDFDPLLAGSLFGGVVVNTRGEISADPNAIFMGCASGAVIKGGLWGYTPYERGPDSAVLDSEVEDLEAVTRVIRADYYADGNPHTEDGTPIQIVDQYFDAFDDAEPFTEAIWGKRGVMCGKATPRVLAGGSQGAPPEWQPDMIDWQADVINVQPGAIKIDPLLQDCAQFGSEWILGAPKFMWTRHAKRDTEHKGLLLPATDESCCATQGGPGCGSPEVVECVAAHDTYCSDVAWDSLCVQEVEWLDCAVCAF